MGGGRRGGRRRGGRRSRPTSRSPSPQAEAPGAGEPAWPSARKPDGCGPRARRAPAPAEQTPPPGLHFLAAQSLQRGPCVKPAQEKAWNISAPPKNFLPDL